MIQEFQRRRFLKTLILTGGSVLTGAFNILREINLLEAKENYYDIVMVRGGSPEVLTKKAIESLGGIERFISRGDVVVIKPNIGWDRLPEQGANTNPEVVGTLVRLCIDAGAKKVKVFDNTCDNPRRCYHQSGIEKSVKAAGGEIFFTEENRFKETKIGGKVLKSWPLYTDLLDADKVINCPVAKHHSLTRVTLSLKNWMGVMGGDRSRIHQQIDQCLADLTLRIRPVFTVLDATRVLLRNGPSGGNLHDVKKMEIVIAGIDQVAVDSWGASLFGIKGEDLSFLKIAEEMGGGIINYKKLRYKVIELKSPNSLKQ